MGRALGLCLLVLLSAKTTFTQNSGVLIFCDDGTVKTAVTSALNTFNKELQTGNKLVLFQVTFASKAENGAYFVQFTTRGSVCPYSEPRPWTDCDYLLIDKKPIDCNATVHMNETHTETEHVDCEIEEPTTADKASCLGCPMEIDENSEDLKAPLSLSISKYNKDSEHEHLYMLNEVGPVTRQVVAGFRFKFTFDMRKTNCSKVEHNELNDRCVADAENVALANCNSTVDMAPWRQETPAVNLDCELGAMPPVVLRRRRPGWSPLRGLLPEELPSPDPTKASKSSSGKKESEESEEDTKPTLSPDASPFHCPSKPWKVFAPVHAGTAAAPVKEAFSDIDLVG